MRILSRTLVLCLGLATLFLPAPALAGGNLNFTSGSRTLDDDFWDPIEEQDDYGLTVDFGESGWPVNIAIGYYQSSNDGTVATFPVVGDVDVEGTINEWSLGAHKVWTFRGPARPFVGGGLTYLETEADLDSALGGTDDDDSSRGIYFEGGVFFRLAEVLNLGLHGRLTEGTDITLFDQDGDADYYQVGLLFGFGWPKGR
jgi:hypothetical protein